MKRAQLLWNVHNCYGTCATSMIYISSQTLQKALNDTIPTYVYVPKLSQIAIWWDKLASLTMKCWIATWENHGILSDAPIDPGQWQAIRCALRWIHGVRHLVEHFRSSYGFLKGFFMGFNQQNMGFNGISCGLMVFNGVSWIFMGFHGIFTTSIGDENSPNIVIGGVYILWGTEETGLVPQNPLDGFTMMYHIRPYFAGIFPYIGLKHRPYIW